MKANFSLKNLMGIVTSVALLLGLYSMFGSASLKILMLSPLIYLGLRSHRLKDPTPFWSLLGSVVILLCLADPIGGIDESTAICNSILFVIGLFLNYSCVRYGRGLARVSGLMVSGIYLFSLFMIFLTGIGKRQVIIQFWLEK